MSALRVLAALVLLGGGFFALYELVEWPRSGAFSPVVTHGSGKMVALTFDDGPTREITGPLLDVLAREHVPATFFVVGSAVRREPALVRRMAAAGHQIEDHSDTHPHLNALFTAAALDAQIERSDDAIYAATGRHARWLRPPFGARSAAVLDAARRHGMRIALWSAMLDETSPHAPAAELAARLLRQVGDGAIVVLHDGDQGRGDRGGRGYEATLAPHVIEALRARGYQFVTLDELSGAKTGRD